MRFERTCVLTTAAAVPAPSEAQLRIRERATNAMILQGEHSQRGVHTETKEDGENQVNHFVLFHLIYSLQCLLRSWWKAAAWLEGTVSDRGRVNEHTDPCSSHLLAPPC